MPGDLSDRGRGQVDSDHSEDDPSHPGWSCTDVPSCVVGVSKQCMGGESKKERDHAEKQTRSRSKMLG